MKYIDKNGNECEIDDSWRRLWTQRKLSILIGITYLGLSIWLGNRSIVLKTLVFLTFAVSCIWFPRALGIPARLFRTATATPEPFVVLAGWMLLLLPAIVAILLYILR